jgi:hypothetical protein
MSERRFQIGLALLAGGRKAPTNENLWREARAIEEAFDQEAEKAEAEESGEGWDPDKKTEKKGGSK